MDKKDLYIFLIALLTIYVTVLIVDKIITKPKCTQKRLDNGADKKR